jgi:hypothetical protein
VDSYLASLFGEASSGLVNELKKTLNGRPCHLSQDTTMRTLNKFRLVPPELLTREVAVRVQRWLRDCDGRQDYSHSFAIRLRQTMHACADESRDRMTTQPANIAAVWLSLSDVAREENVEEIRNSLAETRREALFSSERVHHSITKELFRAYQASNTARESEYAPDSLLCKKPQSWKVWLAMHVRRAERMLREKEEAEGETVAGAAAEEAALQQLLSSPPPTKINPLLSSVTSLSTSFSNNNAFTMRAVPYGGNSSGGGGSSRSGPAPVKSSLDNSNAFTMRAVPFRYALSSLLTRAKLRFLPCHRFVLLCKSLCKSLCIALYGALYCCAVATLIASRLLRDRFAFVARSDGNRLAIVLQSLCNYRAIATH